MYCNNSIKFKINQNNFKQTVDSKYFGVVVTEVGVMLEDVTEDIMH